MKDKVKFNEEFVFKNSNLYLKMYKQFCLSELLKKRVFYKIALRTLLYLP